MTHLRIYGRTIISRPFQLVRISYQKLNFMESVVFSCFPIISMLGGTNQEPFQVQKLLRLLNKLMLMLWVFFVGSVKRKPKKLFVSMVP
jgi:hypothetical protein